MQAAGSASRRSAIDVDHRARRAVLVGEHRVHVERDCRRWPRGSPSARSSPASSATAAGESGLRLEHASSTGAGRSGVSSSSRLVAARGEDQRQRQIGDAVDHVGQPAQRRAVEPVGVVDHDRQRAEAGGQPVEAVQDGVVGLAADRERRGGVRGGAVSPAPRRGRTAAGRRRRRSCARARYPRARSTRVARSRASSSSAVLPIPAGPLHEHAAARAVERRRERGALVLAFEQKSGENLQGARLGDPGRVSTYTVVVALHIIAVVAAYGLPLSAPLLVPYVRRHHPAALPGPARGPVPAQQRRHRAVHRRSCSAFGIYLASDGHRWDEPFVGDRARGDRDHRRRGRRGDRPGAQAAGGARPATRPNTPTVYRRYMAARDASSALSCC